ncbi:MAG: hypothetical protein AB7G25_13970 [Sphingomonadaceae bacterium]
MTAFKRKIFYLSGFDPRGARFYHQLYAEQAAIYARNSGHSLAVSERERAGKANSVWRISDTATGAETDFVFLGWDDVIRAHWVRNPAELLGRSLLAYWRFVRGMDWRQVRRFPRGSLIAFFYPGATAILLPLLLGVLLWLAFGLLLKFPWDFLAATATTIVIAAIIVRKIESLWLLRFIIFNDSFARAVPDPGIERRLDEMADEIQASLREPFDELLFVTHSNGSILAVPIMARLLAMNGGKMPPHFAMMTLGSCIPLIGGRRDSKRFHAELTMLANGDFTWLDLGSITDGACTALVDPCGSCETDARPTLHILSPRWFKYCDPATYDARRRNKYEVHFEYLRTFDRISPLDYIGVTSGARPLPASIAAFMAEN